MKCKKQLSILSMTTVILALSTLLVASCAGSFVIPDNYVTFTDRNGLFSISYPSDWKPMEEVRNQTEQDANTVNWYWDDKGLPATQQPEYFVFAASNGSGESVRVRMRWLREEITREKLYNSTLQVKDYKLPLQDTQRIAGKEFAIFRLGEPPHIGIVSMVVVRQSVWITWCGTHAMYEKDFNTIVRSLRILK